MNLIQKSLFLPTIIFSFEEGTPTSSVNCSRIPVKCLNVTSNITLVDRDGTLIPTRSFFNFYSIDDIVLYQFHIQYDLFSNDIPILSEFRPYWFAYKKGVGYGYKYDDPREYDSSAKFSVDSILNKHALQNFQWHVLAQRTPALRETDINGEVRELYVGPTKYDRTKNDPVFYYYTNKLQEYDFSLSRKLDSIKGMKLYKVTILYPEAKSEEFKITFPKRVTTFEMKEIPVNKPELIRGYVDRFRGEHPNG